MNGDNTTKKALLRALRSVPAAAPGTARKLGRGAHQLGLGDPAPAVRGSLKIEITDAKTGKTDVIVDEHNLVVTQAEALMARMAAGALNSEIGYIELGDPAAPVAPVLTDTGLQQATGQMKAVAFVFSGNSVIFTAVWAVGEANGLTYTEAGLFTNPFAGGTMFARKTGFSITKTAAFSMTFTWTLTFSVVDACSSACTGVALMGSSYVVEDYIYDAVGGEAQVVVPIDFVVGAKRLEVFLNGQRLPYQRDYIEAVIGPNKGIQFQGGLTLIGGPTPDEVYFRHLRW